MWPFLYDYWYFYAASECLQQGSSPYGPCFVAEMHKLARFGTDGSTLRLPPLATPLLYPLAFLSPYPSAILVQIVMAFCLFRSCILLKKNYPLSGSTSFILILACLFFPYVKSTYFGQMSPLFLWIALEAIHSRGYLAGLLFSLGIMKPNLFIPLAGFEIVRRRSNLTGFLVGGVCGVTIQLALGLLLLPTLLGELEKSTAPWRALEPLLQPTLGSLFRLVLDVDLRWYLLLASTLVCSLLGIRRPESLTQFALAATIACLGAPYLWSHDLLLLLPAWLIVINGLSVTSRLFATVMLVLVGTPMILFRWFGEHSLVFVPITLLLLLLRDHSPSRKV